MLNKNDPLIGAVQEVMKRNQAEREAVKVVNEYFGIEDRKALPHEYQAEWNDVYQQVLSESDDMGPVKKKDNESKEYEHKTSGKRSKFTKHPGKEWELCEESIDEKVQMSKKQFANLDGDPKFTANDLAHARKGTHVKKAAAGELEEDMSLNPTSAPSSQPSATSIRKATVKQNVRMGGNPTGQPNSDRPASEYRKAATKVNMRVGGNPTSTPSSSPSMSGSRPMEEERINEKAPPGAKYERMVKHIKAKLGKDGLTDQEKAIAYATAWKAKNKNVNEGFNGRHNLSGNASDESQVVAVQLNELGGVPEAARKKQQQVKKDMIATNQRLAREPKEAPSSIGTRIKQGLGAVDAGVRKFSQGAGGDYVAAAGDWAAKNIAANAGFGKGTSYSKELEQEREKSTRAGVNYPTATAVGAAADDISTVAGLGGLVKGGLKYAAKKTIQKGADNVAAAAAKPVSTATTAVAKPTVSKAASAAATPAETAMGRKAADALKSNLAAKRGNAMRRPVQGAKPVEPTVKPQATTATGVPAVARTPGNKIGIGLNRAERAGPWNRIGPNATASKAAKLDAQAGRVGVNTAAATKTAGLRQKAMQVAKDMRVAGGKALGKVDNVIAKNPKAATAVATGAAGLALGRMSNNTPASTSAATSAATPAADKPKLAQTTTSTQPDYDKMSFKDAFKTARQQASGAGGKFKYKGKEYQTNVQGKGTKVKPQEKYQAASKLKTVAPAAQTQTSTSVTGGQGIAGIAGNSTNKLTAKPVSPNVSMSGGGVNNPKVDAKAQGAQVSSSGLAKPAGSTAQPYGMNVPAKLNPNSRIAQGNVSPKVDAKAQGVQLAPRTPMGGGGRNEGPSSSTSGTSTAFGGPKSAPTPAASPINNLGRKSAAPKPTSTFGGPK
jgi:hypothetical protein